MEEFKRKSKLDVRGNAKAIARLRLVAERVKKTLSTASQASLEVDSLAEGVDFQTTLTRAKFESLCDDLFRKCLVPVEQVLKDGKLTRIDHDALMQQVGESAQRIAARLDMKKLLKGYWPVH
jgi:L1 cell adhesion molecule like protein